jgi:uroporphyrin-3 C-methyltransferase
MKETRNSASEPAHTSDDAAAKSSSTTQDAAATNSSASKSSDTTSNQGSDARAATQQPAAGNSTKTDSSKATADKPARSAAGTAVAATEKRCGATWPGKLALILSILSLSGGAYLVWEGQQLKQQNSQLQEQLTQQVETALANGRAEVAQSINGVSQQLAQLQARFEAEARQVAELQDRLTRSIQQITANRELSRKDWLLAEVEYLLRLANQRVLMEQTPSGALTLLQSADAILSETDDVTLYDVRKALATDIAALEAVPRLDTEGVFLRLGALSQLVDNLRVVPVSERRELPRMLEEITPESVKQSWGEGFKASWNKAVNTLEQLIVIQHHDEPIKPLMSPEQTFFLQQNLRLMLEQAQMALLQRKQEAYSSSLNKAQEWIGTHFDPRDATTQALLSGLSELADLNVAPELPDISGSLTSLKEYLDRMQQLRRDGGQNE